MGTVYHLKVIKKLSRKTFKDTLLPTKVKDNPRYNRKQGKKVVIDNEESEQERHEREEHEWEAQAEWEAFGKYGRG
jgi:hypothetical protein